MRRNSMKSPLILLFTRDGDFAQSVREAVSETGATVLVARDVRDGLQIVWQRGVKICTLEPGGIRTNWARRAGQNAPDLLPDYEASVGSILKMLRSLEGREEGDPRKIADVTLQLASSDEVPVRLILGINAE